MYMLIVQLMGWLSKIFKTSDHRTSEGHYDLRYGSDAVENHPSTSWVRSDILIHFIVSQTIMGPDQLLTHLALC